MGYVDSVLQPGETIRVRGHLHWILYVPAFLTQILALLIGVGVMMAPINKDQVWIGEAFAAFMLLVGIFRLLGRMLERATAEFAVTDHRIISKHGFISRRSVEMNIDKVESVDVDQTVLGRLLGYGTVTVHGTGARWDPIALIADPLKFRSAITAR